MRAHAPASPACPRRPQRDWWIIMGLTVAGSSAAVSSFSGLRGLAILTGWSPQLAVLLPATLDAYAVTATRVWLTAPAGHRRTQRFARANAVGAIGASLTGNAVGHAISTHLIAVTWPAVVLVAALPPTVLGLLTHLAALCQHDGPGRDGPHRSDPDPVRAERPRLSPDLLARARTADADHRDRTGRPIGRDALRAALGVGSTTAAALLEQLRAAPGTDQAARQVTLPRVAQR